MHTDRPLKILIALDYDPSAQIVAEAGFAFAKSISAQVFLLHVLADDLYYSSTVYSPIMGFSGSMNPDAAEVTDTDRLSKKVKQFLDASRQHLGDETIETFVKEGDFATTILHTARNLHADMIVMGAHSQKWPDQLHTGCVTKKVLNETVLPLLVIPIKKK